MNTDWLHMLGYAAHDMPLPAMLGRLLVAVLCGVVVGFERELHDKPLGLRTHVLVALGACGFIVVTLGMGIDLGDEPAVRIDPGRAVAGIIGGIGFLGAGAIIRGGDKIEGTTTAAGIWAMGAIGVAAGFGFYDLALALTGLILLILLGLRGLSRRLGNG